MTKSILAMLAALVAVVISLGWYASSLSDDLDTAQEANGKLVKAVESRDETISALKGAADADRRATEEQLKLEQQKRAKADAENTKLRKALDSSDCSNQRLPDSAIDILHGKA
ncbi:DUF2570 family protein [Serratia sp. N21D137]|uniref:DUF2570 family protein n=1 Tax=Serratia sp. N21D137 TaxID=3397495 RepID=UPI0039E0FC38